MKWKCHWTEKAQEDYEALDGSQKYIVLKAVNKVRENPLPASEGGYGKPLGNRKQTQLAGFYKIKIRGMGLCIVYGLIRTENSMEIVVVAARADEEVYKIAAKRIMKK